MSQTKRRIFNVEWRYLSAEDITIHISKIPIGDTSEISLCPTYSFATHIHHRTTNLSYWEGKGAVAAMRSYSILIYQLTPHPPPNSLLPHRIFTTPPKPIWDQSSHFPRHLASITPFVHYSVFPHQSKRRYEKYFNISFRYMWMSKIFLYQNFLPDVVHIFPSFPYGSKLLFQVCELWTDLSRYWVTNGLARRNKIHTCV